MEGRRHHDHQPGAHGIGAGKCLVRPSHARFSSSLQQERAVVLSEPYLLSFRKTRLTFSYDDYWRFIQAYGAAACADAERLGRVSDLVYHAQSLV